MINLERIKYLFSRQLYIVTGNLFHDFLLEVLIYKSN